MITEKRFLEITGCNAQLVIGKDWKQKLATWNSGTIILKK